MVRGSMWETLAPSPYIALKFPELFDFILSEYPEFATKGENRGYNGPRKCIADCHAYSFRLNAYASNRVKRSATFAYLIFGPRGRIAK